MEARPHPRQQDRLNALYSYEVLDSDREKEFDDVVKLAAQICGTAISVINLIDAERQWFKAETGLGVRQTPLATSLCSHAILEGDFVEIGDTLLDPRMIDNPLCCSEPGLRFYAGALLRSDEGLPIGTLCVLDWKPGALSPLQRDALRVLARQVMAQLDLRRALRQAETLRQEIDHRVKNSLQSISSLARIEARRADSADVKEALLAMDSRIDAVAHVHQQLYQTDAGSAVDLGRYVPTLCDGLGRMARPGVRIEHAIAPVRVSSRQAAAIGMMVNEFAANALKYAFPDARDGRVLFEIVEQPGGSVLFRCSDDGVGLPGTRAGNGSGNGPGNGSGIGSKIAEVVSHQLGCDIRLPRVARGLTVAFEFTPEAQPGAPG